MGGGERLVVVPDFDVDRLLLSSVSRDLVYRALNATEHGVGVSVFLIEVGETRSFRSRATNRCIRSCSARIDCAVSLFMGHNAPSDLLGRLLPVRYVRTACTPKGQLPVHVHRKYHSGVHIWKGLYRDDRPTSYMPSLNPIADRSFDAIPVMKSSTIRANHTLLNTIKTVSSNNQKSSRPNTSVNHSPFILERRPVFSPCSRQAEVHRRRDMVA